MTVITKYSLDDIIFFVLNGDIKKTGIVGVETCITETVVSVAYICPVQHGTVMQNIAVREKDAYDSMEDLVKALSNNYYKSIAEHSD